MMRRFAFAGALALLVAGALAIRVPNLGDRPFHGDESVHAAKFRDIWERGEYIYDPYEFHGPTLYYAALPVAKALGREHWADIGEADYRLATVIVGTLLLLFLALMRDALGRRGALVCALLLALSPAFVYYSRHFIQETLLVAFTLGLFACGWRWTRSGRLGWAIAAGASAGMMVATKETVVLTFAALCIALAVVWFRQRAKRAVRPWRGHAALAAVTALVVAVTFLTGFFSNLAAPVDYLRSYLPWGMRAHATELHAHPWSYYLAMLLWTHRAPGPVWSEALIVGLALAGGVACWRGASAMAPERAAFGRFMAVFTIAITAIYSAIPYKTPWCVLTPLLGMVLLAGPGALALVAALPRRFLLRPVAVTIVAALTAQLGWQAWRSSQQYATDTRNPYVYAQTMADVRGIVARVEELAREHPDRMAMVVKVISEDAYYWPLPWYLRRMHNVGYWTEMPETLDAPVVIASPRFDEALTARLEATHLMTGFFVLRPHVLLQVWVDFPLWSRYVEKRSPRRPVRIGE
ncbi:MAG TPA: flippase activity-associated protein Agl23 [Chthonomonadales bacterium]|nr:flippase activity-associated protein Agl23 [Chthonomonadales bacterium]